MVVTSIIATSELTKNKKPGVQSPVTSLIYCFMAYFHYNRSTLRSKNVQWPQTARIILGSTP